MLRGPRGSRGSEAPAVGKACWPLQERGFPGETALRGAQCRAHLYEPLSLCSVSAVGSLFLLLSAALFARGAGLLTSPLHRVLTGQSGDSVGPAA